MRQSDRSPGSTISRLPRQRGLRAQQHQGTVLKGSTPDFRVCCLGVLPVQKRTRQASQPGGPNGPLQGQRKGNVSSEQQASISGDQAAAQCRGDLSSEDSLASSLCSHEIDLHRSHSSECKDELFYEIKLCRIEAHHLLTLVSEQLDGSAQCRIERRSLSHPQHDMRIRRPRSDRRPWICTDRKSTRLN